MNRESTPRVTVIIATFNYGRYIADALRSVQDQTLRALECLIIDDASTDNTAVVVAKFTGTDPRFRYIRLERNVGVSAARNRGLSEAKGEYIQFLDADDVIAPSKLELQAKVLDASPELSVVYSDVVRFSGAVDFAAVGETIPADKFQGDPRSVVSRLLRGNAFRLNTVLFRRRLVDKLGGFQEHLRHVEDWDLWMRFASAGHRFQFLDEPAAMAGVRVEHASLSRDLPAMRRNQLAVREQMWIQGGLDTWQRISLLLRSCDFVLELVVVKGEEVVFLKDGSGLFKMLTLCLSVVLFPVWMIARPFFRPWV